MPPRARKRPRIEIEEEAIDAGIQITDTYVKRGPLNPRTLKLNTSVLYTGVSVNASASSSQKGPVETAPGFFRRAEVDNEADLDIGGGFDGEGRNGEDGDSEDEGEAGPGRTKESRVSLSGFTKK